jgi:glycosyltransferase involved in cell wall biosynthesis
VNRPLHLIILNRCFPPEIGATGKVTRDLGRILAQKHITTFLVGRPVATGQPQPYAFFQREHQDGFTVERLGSTVFSHRRMIGRLVNYASYLCLALFRCLTLRPKPDVVIAMTDPPLACLVGMLTAHFRKCKFIYNIRDLHPDMAVAAGLVRPGWGVALWERLHRWALTHGDLVVVLGEDMKERILSKGVQIGSIVVVRDGSEPIDPVLQTEHPVIKAIRRDFPFVLIHAGNLGFAGSWVTILDAARLLADENIGIVFIGDGVLRSKLESLSKDLSHVRFLNYLPQEELPYVLGAGDLHVVTVKKGLEGLVVPSKMYPILMSGRPILAITPEGSDVSRLVRGAQCGLVADPNDAGSVVQNVLFARNHPEEVSRMAYRARDLGKQFDRNALANEFVRAIEEVAVG